MSENLEKHAPGAKARVALHSLLPGMNPRPTPRAVSQQALRRCPLKSLIHATGLVCSEFADDGYAGGGAQAIGAGIEHDACVVEGANAS